MKAQTVTVTREQEQAFSDRKKQLVDQLYYGRLSAAEYEAAVQALARELGL